MSKYIKKINRERGGLYPCEICGKFHYRTPIRTKNRKHFYCSRKCSILGLVKYPAKPIRGIDKTCPICGKAFYVCAGSINTRKYCSRNCANKSYEKPHSKTQLICHECGKPYEQYVSYLKIRKSKYCSVDCQNKAASKRTGELSHNWKGGLTDKKRCARTSAEWRGWRKSVFERDDYTCQICGAKNSKINKHIIKLHPHHLKSFKDYPELRFNIDNGQTLCSTCHYELHGNMNKGHIKIQKYICKPKICPACNEIFLAKSEKHYICSHKCHERLHRKKIKDAKARQKLLETL